MWLPSVGGSPRSVYGPVLVLPGDLWVESPGKGPSEGNRPAWIRSCSIPSPQEGPSAGGGGGGGGGGWLKGDASCARPGDPSEKKPEGRAGSGRGAVPCVSGSGGSARPSARTASRSRPTCRHMASPLGGEEIMSAIVCPTPPSGPPLHPPHPFAQP